MLLWQALVPVSVVLFVSKLMKLHNNPCLQVIVFVWVLAAAVVIMIQLSHRSATSTQRLLLRGKYVTTNVPAPDSNQPAVRGRVLSVTTHSCEAPDHQ
jgi:hypothetical protein